MKCSGQFYFCPHYPDHSFDKRSPVDIYKYSLPINWEKGFKDSRIQGFKCSFSSYFQLFENFINTSDFEKCYADVFVFK